MERTRADFSYSFSEIGGHKALAIVDLDTDGRMSVTNDIENVVSAIATTSKIDPREYMIVYADSDGVWDGWDAKKGNFVGLRQETVAGALAAYMAVKGYSLN